MDEKETKVTYKQIIDLMRELDSQYKSMREIVTANITGNFNLDISVLDNILPIKLEDCDTLPVEELKEFLSTYGSEENTENLIETYIESAQEPNNVTEEEAVRFIMKEVKQSSLTLLETKANCDEIRNDAEEILNEYYNYISSPKAKALQLKQLETMKKEAELETDPIKKKETIEKIEIMESAKSLSFISERFMKLGKAEIRAVKEAFFDDKKGSYIINKYENKIHNFGFDPKQYKHFFNLEENFLPDSYYPFNNLFLFVYMRFAAYADFNKKSDRMFVQSITEAIANLIYHKNVNNEEEAYLISIIKKVDDLFIEYKDYFNENNTTNPNHPLRIEAEKRHEVRRRETLLKTMKDFKIEGYDPNWSNDKLQEYFNEKIEEMTKEQIKANGDNTEVKEEDGVVTVTPKLESTTEE